MKIHRIVITPGEPAGIGPDLVIHLAQRDWPVELVVCADEKLLSARAALLNLPLKLIPYISLYSQPVAQRAGTLTLLSIPLCSYVIPGKLNVENSHYVIDTLIRASDGCQHGEFAAMVTGPVNKKVINDAGIPFTGHTEFFEKHTKSLKAVMMLATETLRVALVTTHLPVKDIPATITPNLLRNVINILHQDLHNKFGIQTPNILVCGLNPHSGEGGYIGKEEINVIIPVLEEMRAKGISLNGPLPADTIFQSKYLESADVVLAMYHDQGLPILKQKNFGIAVNITLGLPFIRTSVDHGTALDLAGKKNIDINSFIAAINLAIKMIINVQ